MIHSIQWRLQKHWNWTYLHNDFFGVETQYQWLQEFWLFFLYPLIDDHSKSIYYFAWDNHEQKEVFTQLLKISWIGPKTAFLLSNSDYNLLQQAVHNMNIQFFEKIPGIGPKTAKRLIVELKPVLKTEDLHKIQWDEKVIKDIIKYCKWLWYNSDTIKDILLQCPIGISQSSSTEVIKRLISKL